MAKLTKITQKKRSFSPKKHKLLRKLQNIRMYYSYHAQAKKLIKQGCLIASEVVENYHGIKPALVLYFSNHKPMPIRQNHWDEYFQLIEKFL